MNYAYRYFVFAYCVSYADLPYSRGILPVFYCVCSCCRYHQGKDVFYMSPPTRPDGQTQRNETTLFRRFLNRP